MHELGPGSKRAITRRGPNEIMELPLSSETFFFFKRRLETRISTHISAGDSVPAKYLHGGMDGCLRSTSSPALVSQFKDSGQPVSGRRS